LANRRLRAKLATASPTGYPDSGGQKDENVPSMRRAGIAGSTRPSARRAEHCRTR